MLLLTVLIILASTTAVDTTWEIGGSRIIVIHTNLASGEWKAHEHVFAGYNFVHGSFFLKRTPFTPHCIRIPQVPLCKHSRNPSSKNFPNIEIDMETLEYWTFNLANRSS